MTIGGHTGVHQFTRIGRHAMVGGMSKLTKDVPPFFLVEGNPCQPYGLNSVGLRRAAFSAEERNEIKKFYKLLYNPKLNVSQAIEAMKARSHDRTRPRDHRLSRSARPNGRAE